MSRTEAKPALRSGEFISLVALLMSLVALSIDLKCQVAFTFRKDHLTSAGCS